ncbi:MAG: FixG Ig-like domain-containing protein, partial [Thalassovita sp.]|nr:FixG Ig-like domain-containing protein [Thalassovita sp.]
ALFVRPELEVTVRPDRNPTFVILSDGSIRNTYEVRLRNKHGEDRPFYISLTGHPALRVQLEGTAYASVTVPADDMLLQRVHVIAPKGSEPAESERVEFRFWVEDTANGERAYKDTIFNGRAN